MLEESKNNYFACLYAENGVWAVCFCDVSTGAFSATRIAGADAEPAVCNELSGFCPAEVLLGGAAEKSEAVTGFLRERLRCCVTAAHADTLD